MPLSEQLRDPVSCPEYEIETLASEFVLMWAESVSTTRSLFLTGTSRSQLCDLEELSVFPSRSKNPRGEEYSVTWVKVRVKVRVRVRVRVLGVGLGIKRRTLKTNDSEVYDASNG